MAADGTAAPRFLSVDDFRRRLGFLRASGIGQVRLLGGEPTLHPEFPVLVALALEGGFSLMVFSHGLMPRRALDCLLEVPEDRSTVLVNLTAARTVRGPTEAEARWRRRTLERLGRRAMVGVNLATLPFDGTAVLRVVRETGCRPSVRVGIALPVLDGDNLYLPPKRYRAAGRQLVHFIRKAISVGVGVECDCGWVPCMFSPSEHDLLRRLGWQGAWHCGPILDVDLDGRVLHCFPLARLGRRWEKGDTASALRSELDAEGAPYRSAGLFPECQDCGYRHRGVCRGGCLAAVRRRFRPAVVRLRVPPVAPDLQAREASQPGEFANAKVGRWS